MTIVFSTFFQKLEKLRNVKYRIPIAAQVKSLLYEYLLSFFSETVPYSSQDAIYTTLLASVIFSLLSFLPDVNVQRLEDASSVHEQEATSYLCDENSNFEELGRFLKRQNGTRISFPLSLALFLFIH